MIGFGCKTTRWRDDFAGGADPFWQRSIPREGSVMEALLGIVTLIGHAIEAVLAYVESHHWIFGLVALGYIFYLHDRALHARFDAIEKRVDEIRKRLAIEY
jgi:hypothetical protein